jgi:hypothetical protein
MAPNNSGDVVAPIFIHNYATIVIKSHVPMSHELKNSNLTKLYTSDAKMAIMPWFIHQ